MMGVRRSFSPDRSRPRLSKVGGVILATLSVAIIGLFVFATLINARRLPSSQSAPQISQKAPDFTLTDTNGKPVTLSELLTSPINGNSPKGVLLVFYRGYW
jgi:hypothetical protein